MKRERFCLRKLGFTHEGTLRHRVFFRFVQEMRERGMVQHEQAWWRRFKPLALKCKP